ncbi:chalcone synthase 4-like [Mangifera indica]|uniref:chalcone synthase 4-like n=1 Tax=Mangifera indica TaxID=29780 RepID=UPI001CF9E46D|nr:chalcone synthase 4-like [Mangifera indica]
MALVEKMVAEKQSRRAQGSASILRIATANPPNVFYQTDYPDFCLESLKVITWHKSKISSNAFLKRYLLLHVARNTLHLAKDIVENNAGTRVLIVSSELMLVCFNAPSDTYFDVFVGSAIFKDGVVGVIVGIDLNTTTKRPLFQLFSASQDLILD